MIKKVLKSKIELLIKSLPYGRDLFLVMFRSRLTISYRGVYLNYKQASKSISSSEQSYDKANRKKRENKEKEIRIIDSKFRNHDYPFLFWLSRLLSDSTRILELGGSLGHFYYSAKNLIGFPEKLKWQIAELPEAVSFGTELASERNEKQLTYIDSSQVENSQPANVFISSGAIQYMTVSLVEILTSLPCMPEHVIIHDLPVHSQTSFWTTQRLEYCEIPYHVYFLNEFIEDLNGLGFELISQWNWLRPMEIPFHKALSLSHLQGFYFKKKFESIA